MHNNTKGGRANLKVDETGNYRKPKLTDASMSFYIFYSIFTHTVKTKTAYEQNCKLFKGCNHTFHDYELGSYSVFIRITFFQLREDSRTAIF